MTEDYKEIQVAVEGILQVKTHVKRKRRSDSDKKMELFVSLIMQMEEILIRSQIMNVDLQLDFYNYDEKFMRIIDGLFYISFGNQGADLISYYLYERLNEDGTIKPLIGKNGTEIIIENPYQLWDIISTINSSQQ
jgi:hypothetical protein